MKESGGSSKVERLALPVISDAPAHQDDASAELLRASDVTPASGEHGYGATYWRSIDEKLGSEQFKASLDREFPEGATEPPDGVGRRDFISLLGASMALAGLTACQDRPREKILPYTRTPADLAPGTPLHFATAASLGGYATGLLVTSWEGRPTKVEGNPDHPTSGGRTGILDQALILQMYDPERARVIKKKGQPGAWRLFLKEMAETAKRFDTVRGEGLRFLLEPTSSPLHRHLRERLALRFPKAVFHSYAAVSEDNAFRGAELAFNQQTLQTNYDFKSANVVVSLDSDFLQPLPRNMPSVRQFSDRRDPKLGALNRLYVLESQLSITGSMADHRLRVRPSEVGPFALALLNQVAPGSRPNTPTLGAEQTRWVKTVAADLLRNRGQSIVVAGDRQPPVVHALAHALNSALDNFGKTVRFTKPVLVDTEVGPSSLQSLANAIQANSVDTLVVTAWNPAYSAPADLQLNALLPRVPNLIYRALHEDETSRHAGWFIPATHLFESWGDAVAADGTVSIVQPLIAPLFNGYTDVEVLTALLGEAELGAHGHLKAFWGHPTEGTSAREREWEKYLAQGIVSRPSVSEEHPSVDLSRIEFAPQSGNLSSLEINFLPDARVYDGRFANVTWLQELPDPISRITWDNAALISTTTARKLEVESGDVLRIQSHGRSIEAPAWVMPGHADDVISIALGYGRDGEEHVARGTGVNANLIRRSDAPWFDSGVTVTKTGRTHKLAVTQEHWSMKATPESAERPIALEANTEELPRMKEFTEGLRGPQPTLQEPVKYDGFAWAMAIDLSRCVGCNACVIACQSENNIPVVGKEQVAKGREMHWLRIDRYFRGSIENPSMVSQPVACVHCEAAPCEYVCPVNATVHSDEGLNEMIYNRCVGTRYCSNNCPYKVRRFNYLHWNANKSAIDRMQMNPDVTVRGRGVMEKCTYCVQRIERARISSRVEGRELRDGDIKTACQQACPASALSFGTLSDPKSQVSELHRDERRYDLLHDLNTRPRTAYLVRIKNPNPELS